MPQTPGNSSGVNIDSEPARQQGSGAVCAAPGTVRKPSARFIYGPLRSRNSPRFPGLLDRHGLGEVARLIDVAAAAHGDVIGEQLQRHDLPESAAAVPAPGG